MQVFPWCFAYVNINSLIHQVNITLQKHHTWCYTMAPYQKHISTNTWSGHQWVSHPLHGHCFITCHFRIVLLNYCGCQRWNIIIISIIIMKDITTNTSLQTWYMMVRYSTLSYVETHHYKHNTWWYAIPPYHH